jgi:8-oxo-dGTP pyrophosphatase MutT (NUDIX family)/ribosomal protein S18 acetylase RimI-like enzyme
MIIRRAVGSDFAQMWPIFAAVVSTGDSYVFAADTTSVDAHEYFFGPDVASFVAEAGGRVVGFYKLIPNRRDRGSHVANASYMVDPTFRARGAGRRLGLHSLREARARGFRAMQFNFVVSTNARAVDLWKSLGFAIVGIFPRAFQHATLGEVDAYAMYRSLEDLPIDDTNDLPTFGEEVDGYPYLVRPSAYAVILDDSSRLAVARAPEGLFLPGGGLDPGESPEQAAVREAQEECAIEIADLRPLGRAVDVVFSPKKSANLEKRSLFFTARLVGTSGERGEHELLWLERESAALRMKDGGHAWAIRRLGTVPFGECPKSTRTAGGRCL